MLINVDIDLEHGNMIWNDGGRKTKKTIACDFDQITRTLYL
jgi:hypothetical protein